MLGVSQGRGQSWQNSPLLVTTARNPRRTGAAAGIWVWEDGLGWSVTHKATGAG